MADIWETISNIDLVMITMNGITDDYQMFITSLNVRDISPNIEELTGILMQEEGRQMTLKA